MPRSAMAIVFVLTALILAGAGAVELWLTDREWDTTTGVVVSSEVEVRRNPLAHEAWKREVHVPVVRVQYEVFGQTYTTDRMWAGIAPDEESHIAEGAEAVVADYPVGARVPVRYDADDPANAALNVASGPGWILIGLGGAVLAWGVFLLRRGVGRATRA